MKEEEIVVTIHMTEYIVKYPEEPTAMYSIEMVEMLGLWGKSYYPIIRKDGIWLHEFGCSWDDKEKAMEAAKKYVNDLVKK